MTLAARLQHIARVMKFQSVHRRGYVIHKSRAGVPYVVPFSRCRQYIQPGKPTADGRVYVQSKRGNLVFSHRVDIDGNRLAA